MGSRTNGMLVSGLGVLLEELDGYLVVQKVFPGGPVFLENEDALKQDPDADTVQLGDVLLTLGNREVKGISEAEIKEAFRGPVDTRVKLGFARRPVPPADQSIRHFSLDVLRRSSVRELGLRVKSEIRQGSPNKLAGRAQGLSPSPSKQDKRHESMNGDNSFDRRDARESEKSVEAIAQENMVLKQSLIAMEEQLEEAERNSDLAIKIVERVQTLEDKLLETEFNLAVSQQKSQLEQLAAQENMQLKEMLQEARQLHALALDKCRLSEQEAERAQHQNRLYVERDKALREELHETKNALDKSRMAESILSKQLHVAEQALKTRSAFADVQSPGKTRRNGASRDWILDELEAQGTSDDELYPITPNIPRQALTDPSKETRRKMKKSNQYSSPPLRKDVDTKVISNQLLCVLEERDEWVRKYTELEAEMKGLRERVKTSLDFLSRAHPLNTPAELSLATTALFYSMAFINEGLDHDADQDLTKSNISPWVVSALNHIASVSQPPQNRDKSVLRMREDIAHASSKAQINLALFELGCILSMATPDSFGTESIKGIVRDVSHHLKNARVKAVGAAAQGVSSPDLGVIASSSTESGVDVLRFATFCLCPLSTWASGRQALVACEAAQKLVHILSHSDDTLTLEFCSLVLGNCAMDPEGSAIAVLGAPTLCKMLKSRSENLRSNALNAVCNLSLNRKWARVIATQPVIQTTLQSLCRSRDTVECKRSECILREIKPYLSQQQGQEDNWADVQESKLKFQTFLP